jgi:hypothetical protein
MVATLDLQIEVVGCPTVCRHCWAQGIPYPAMLVDDIAWVLEQTHRFCDDHGLGVGAYPMHELAVRSQAAEVLHTGVAGMYRERHGNLHSDGARAVLGRALEQGGRPSTRSGSGRTGTSVRCSSCVIDRW